MAFLAFDGDRVAAVNSANDDGSGGVDLELDTDRDLDGSGNPYYSPTSKIVIEIDDADIGPNGEFQQGGSDGEVTVLSIKVDGVEILSDTDKIKFGGGGDTFEGDGYFFVDGVKLFFLLPIYTETFSDAAMDSGKLVLNVPDRVSDNDFNDNSKIDSGTTEVGNGVFNIQTSNVVCFAGGTMIQTPNGEVPVEALEVGDSVEMLDHGPR